MLLITGYAETATLSDTEIEGVRLLTKPFALDVLAAHIKELLADSK